MTIVELIDRLRELPPDNPVVDCTVFVESSPGIWMVRSVIGRQPDEASQ